jgi:predicted DNA-binding transcriptional regulator AlpA
MLITITQAASRLGWHRTTVWRRAQSDPSFPTVVYIGPKSPRINSDELDRWISRSKALNSDFMHVSPDLLKGKARGPQRRTRMAAA